MGYSLVHRGMGKPTRIQLFSKNSLVILNIISIVFGFILLVYGIGGKPSTKRDSLAEINGDVRQATSTSTILIIIGSISMIMGLYGLHGVRNYCKAATYISLLICFAVVDVLLGEYSSTLELNARNSIEESLISSFQGLKQSAQNSTVTVATATTAWDSLQSELKCCGVYGYRDWYQPISARRVEQDWGAMNGNGSSVNKELVIGIINNHYGNAQDFIRIPSSCFKHGEDGMEDVDFNDAEFIIENVFSDGCLEKVAMDLDIDRVQRVAVLVAFIKLLAVLFAIILACHLNDKAHLAEFV